MGGAGLIADVAAGPNLERVRTLFREYGDFIERTYRLQGYDAELAALPGGYVPPRGGLWLLTENETPAGAVALRDMGGNVAEIKRLYVRPEFQGRGYGRLLARVVVTRARDVGYDALRLDTLGHLAAAQALYRDMGFADIPPYHDDVVPGMRFMELAL